MSMLLECSILDNFFLESSCILFFAFVTETHKKQKSVWECHEINDEANMRHEDDIEEMGCVQGNLLYESKSDTEEDNLCQKYLA